MYYVYTITKALTVTIIFAQLIPPYKLAHNSTAHAYMYRMRIANAQRRGLALYHASTHIQLCLLSNVFFPDIVYS